MLRIKICCIASEAEAALAVSCGAAALGLVSAMPSGPGVIGEALIRTIVRGCPPGVSSFLLTSLTDAVAMIEQIRYCGTDTVQIVDTVSPDTRRAIKAALSNVKVVQVVHVRGEESLEEARRCVEGADALLLDSGNPTLATKELGGTGQVHNWELSRAIVEASTLPVFLAGGLTPENVAAAVDMVRPYGIDVCSGVRKNGRLNRQRLLGFVAAATG